MVLLKKLRGLAVILGLALLASVSAYSDQVKDNEFTDFNKMAPSAMIDFEITSVKLIAGASWGTGTMQYEGKSYPVKVSAGTVGGVGYRSMKGTGKVYKLNKLEDVAGVYSGGIAGATIGNKGGGVSTLENGKGVVIKATATESSGAQLSIGLGGLEIELIKE
ncbi:MAG: hypothetical protein GY792_17270 [Gammaproteobacteria bacterium]|nr:hypothetical protein [Gammaproteobacteria bacterium]